MINSNNIYKLIKKAKDEYLNTSDPISKIIQHPITFIYSFTLNAQNEPIKEDEVDNNFISKINQNNQTQIKKNKDNNIKLKIDNDMDKFNIVEKNKNFLNKKRDLVKNINTKKEYK